MSKRQSVSSVSSYAHYLETKSKVGTEGAKERVWKFKVKIPLHVFSVSQPSIIGACSVDKLVGLDR